MKEMSQLLKNYLLKPISIVMVGRNCIDGIIEEVGDEIVLLQSLDENDNSQHEIIHIQYIASVKLSGKLVDAVKKVMFKELIKISAELGNNL